MSDAFVTLVGNLTREPELRFTAGGKAVANAGIAVNHRYQVAGEWQEKVSFFNLTVWDTMGENFAASCVKGMRVVLTGRLEQREYETKDGEKRTSVEVIVDEIGPALRWARCTVERIAGKTPAMAGAPAGDRGNGDPVYGEEPF